MAPAPTTPVAAHSVAPAAASPAPGPNRSASSFGALEVPAYPRLDPDRAEIVAHLALRPAGGFANATWVLFAFNLHTPTVRVAFESITDAAGRPLPIDRDERSGNPLQPRVLLKPSSIPADGAVQLHGVATARNNGFFHLGVLVLAFNADWSTARTPEGEPAELYATAQLSATALQPGGLAPPFEGSGNPPALVVALMFLLAAPAGAVFWARRTLKRRAAPGRRPGP